MVATVAGILKRSLYVMVCWVTELTFLVRYGQLIASSQVRWALETRLIGSSWATDPHLV